jgi:hypothetical protein
MRTCIPPVLPLFSCIASLYSLAPIIPNCSVTNRWVVRATFDWLANSVRLVSSSYSHFGLVHMCGLAGRGLIGVCSLCAVIWLVGLFSVSIGVCCWSDWG